VKQQINGSDRIVLKENATSDDLRAEAVRMQHLLGYEVESDERRARYIATHRFFRGKFVLSLQPD
jgi:hypothetical protein